MESYRNKFEDTFLNVCRDPDVLHMNDDDFERTKRRVTYTKRYSINRPSHNEQKHTRTHTIIDEYKRPDQCVTPTNNMQHTSASSNASIKDRIKIKIRRNQKHDCDTSTETCPCIPTDKVIDISEPTANPTFNLPNSGDKRPDGSVVDPGWHPVHRVIKKTTSSSNITIITNNERRPFGSGVIRSVYVIDRGELWEYISKGFTECEFDKETNNPEVNGYGFEVVIRVAKNTNYPRAVTETSKGDDTTKHEWPDWPVEILASLLSLHTNGNIEIKPGDILDIFPGIAPDVPTAMSIAFTRDPRWNDRIDTPFGAVCFYQAVLLSRGEGDLASYLGANRFIRSLYFDNVPHFNRHRKDSHKHALWTRFKDDVEIEPVQIDGLALTAKGVDVRIVIPNEPVNVFKLLLSLVHGMHVKWVNPRTGLEITWIKLCSDESQDCDSSVLKHVIYITPNGMSKLFNLFDNKATMWSEEVRDTPPWPLLIEDVPCVELDIRL